MSWTTAVIDLRTLLNDGPKDKYRFRKRVFGELNGTNLRFKTFEFRRVSDFTVVVNPLGIYKDGILLPPAAVATDFVETGEFELVVAPIDGEVLEASYYSQWFYDAELQEFLSTAAQWIGYAEGAYASIPDGLQPAALKYAAAEAYLKLAMKWREYYSEMYRVENVPDNDLDSTVKSFMDLSDLMGKKAKESRQDFYKRSDQYLSPLFGINSGRTRDVMPKG